MRAKSGTQWVFHIRDPKHANGLLILTYRTQPQRTKMSGFAELKITGEQHARRDRSWSAASRTTNDMSSG